MGKKLRDSANTLSLFLTRLTRFVAFSFLCRFIRSLLCLFSVVVSRPSFFSLSFSSLSSLSLLCCCLSPFSLSAGFPAPCRFSGARPVFRRLAGNPACFAGNPACFAEIRRTTRIFFRAPIRTILFEPASLATWSSTSEKRRGSLV